jgi:parallel beta-helix repeat protein
MEKRIPILLFAALLCLNTIFSQVSINESGTPPDISAVLDISASDKGLLVPRMMETQRDLISLPANSLLIYQTDQVSGYYYNAGSPDMPDWQPLSSVIATIDKRGTEIDTLPFFISTPGNYYLNQTLTGQPSEDGITIQSSGVTIDLGGFSIMGGGGVSGAGITVPDSVNRLKVFNGTITGWEDVGIKAENANYSEYTSLLISDNQGDGILSGANCFIHACTAINNASDGIDAGDNNIISNCLAAFNMSDGIETGISGIVESSTSRENGSNGFRVGGACTIRSCTANENEGDGFNVGSGSNVTQCVASNNESNGFQCLNDTYLGENTADSNTKSGFYTSFSDSRIEKNNGTDNSRYGFEIVGSGGCLIIQNSASGNVLNAYAIGVGHIAGPIINGATMAANTNPNANISY